MSWFTCRRTKAREIKCLAKFTWLLVAKLGLTLSRVLFTTLHKLPIMPRLLDSLMRMMPLLVLGSVRPHHTVQIKPEGAGDPVQPSPARSPFELLLSVLSFD